MTNFDDERRAHIQRMIDQQKESRSLQASRRDDDIYQTLELSKPTAIAARKLEAVNDSMTEFSAMTSDENVSAVMDRNLALILMARNGSARRFLAGQNEVLAASQRFLANEENHYNSRTMVRKYKDEGKRREYAMQYERFGQYVRAMVKLSNEQMSVWNSYLMTEELTPAEHPFGKVENRLFGDVLHHYSAEFKRQRRDRLNTADFSTFCELFLSVVRMEKQQGTALKRSTNTSEERFVKMLFELSGVHLHNVDELLEQLPPSLAALIKDGRPFVEFIQAFITQLLEAIVTEDHPAHEQAVELLTELNSFRIEGVPIPGHLLSQSFNYQLCNSFAHKDFFGDFNYQDFICKLSDLANSNSPQREWYAAFLSYLRQSQEYFNYHPVYEAERAAELFDRTLHGEDVEVTLATNVRKIFDPLQSQNLSIYTDEQMLPPETSAIQGNFTSVVQARRMKGDSYVINTVLTVIGDKSSDQGGLFVRKLQKFRYQVRIDEGQVSVHLPVIDRENISDELRSVALLHTATVIGLLAEEVEESDVHAPHRFQFVESTPVSVHKKSGNREQRMAEHAAMKDSEPVDSEKVRAAQQSTENIQVSSVEEEAVSKFLPNHILLSPSMSKDIERGSKKGATAVLSRQVSEFVTQYNAAKPSEKPGKGIQLTDVYGPSNENVFRFRTSYQTRCIVVEIEGGVGLLISIDNRDDAYSGAGEMRKVVARELDKYYRSQGK